MFTETLLDQMQTLGFLFGALFIALGAFDGLYFHIVKYQLHLHAESRLEHVIHSIRGILLAAIGALVFATTSHQTPVLGVGLMVGLGLIVVDLTLEVADIYVERASRANLGGVSSSEMVLHVFASSFRMAALALLLMVAYYRGFSSTVGYLGLAGSTAALVISVASFAPKDQPKRVPLSVGFQQ